MAAKSPITTHVLDVSKGRPAEGVPVTLMVLDAKGHWKALARGRTNADGRIDDLLPRGTKLRRTIYRMTFGTATYYRLTGVKGFYPAVTITFSIGNPEEHHHIPLLLSPYGYSTYRGS